MPEYKHILTLFTGALIIIAQVNYIYGVCTRKNKPAVLSWIGWALLMGVSLFSQVISKGWSLNLIGLSLSTSGCLLIAILAFFLQNFEYKKADLKYLYLGIICVLIYLLAKNVWLTTSLAIVADLILAIPTIKNAWLNPEKEKSIAWPLALASWICSMVFLLFDFSWIYALWPIYLIAFNVIMTYSTYVRVKRKSNL